MRTFSTTPKLFALLLLASCSIANLFEKTPPSITTTETIFLDINPDIQSTFIATDGIVPNLEANIAKELENRKIKIATKHADANVILKVKTRFAGKVLKRDLPKLLEDETSFASLSNFEIKDKQNKNENSSTMIDRLVEDPSGMIAGFAIGAAMSNPIVFAPIGMVVGSAINFGIGSAISQSQNIIILDIEIHEKTQKPIWYTDKRLHKKDEYSVRRYEYSESTNWKVYKTRVIANGTTKNLHKYIIGLIS
jgi:hypothetical protein